MQYFGGVLREGCAPFTVFLGNHVEDALQFRQSLFAGGHQGITARNGRYLGNPGAIILPVQHGFVVSECHIYRSRGLIVAP